MSENLDMKKVRYVPKVVKVGEGWRIVVPEDIREKLGLQKGDYVRYGVEDGKVVIKKVIFQEVEA